MRFTWLRLAAYGQGGVGKEVFSTPERWSHTVSATVQGMLSYVQDSGHVRFSSLVLCGLFVLCGSSVACSLRFGTCPRPPHITACSLRHIREGRLISISACVQERWYDSEQILRGAINRCDASQPHDLLALAAALLEIHVLQRNWKDALTAATDVAGAVDVSMQHTPASVSCLRLTAAAEAAMVRPLILYTFC